MPSSQFHWTATEIPTYQGFYVASGNKNYATDELRFLVVRYKDDRSSALCQRIEEMSMSQGGIVIYDESAIRRGFSSDYRTGLFHKNCRCRLIPKPQAFGDRVDELDFQVAAGMSSINASELSRLEGKLTESTYKKLTSQKFRQRVGMVTSVNISGRHWLHDRRSRRL